MSNPNLRAQLVNEIAQNVAKKLSVSVPSGGAGIMEGVPGGSHLGAIDWGGIITGLINTTANTYASKEIQKTQANLANKLAEAEAKKLLALTELELAKAQTQAQQTALLQKQNELQQILKDIEFTGVQKWMLGGAGLLAFAFGAYKLIQLSEKPKRAVRR